MKLKFLTILLLLILTKTYSQNNDLNDLQDDYDFEISDYEIAEEDVSNDELFEFLLTEDDINPTEDDIYITFFKEDDYEFEDELTYDDEYQSKDRPLN